MPAFTLDVSTLDSGATLGEEAPFSPYLAPSETLLAGDLLAPSEGAVYPSSVTYPGEHVYNDELHMVFRNRDSGFWKEPLDWERADISPAHLYYEEFVRPLKHLQGGHIRTPGSWLSVFATNPEAGTIAWNESNGTLNVFDGDFWREIATGVLPFNDFNLDESYIGGRDVMGYDSDVASDSFVADVSTLDGPHFAN